MDHMDQIRRERATEAKVRAIDADDIVAWIHELEDTIADLEDEALPKYKTNLKVILNYNLKVILSIKQI